MSCMLVWARLELCPVHVQLNGAPYCPRRDYKSNRLIPGRLQLAGRTQVLLDETVMTNGQLQTNGILNLQARAGASYWTPASMVALTLFG